MDVKKTMKVSLILILVAISMSTIAFATGTVSTVSIIKNLEPTVKIFGSIILLFFMIVDIVESFKNKNSSILGVMLKYSMCLVALYSYAPIFNFIDKAIALI